MKTSEFGRGSDAPFCPLQIAVLSQHEFDEQYEFDEFFLILFVKFD